MDPLKTVQEEFEAIGLRIESVNMHRDVQPIMTMGAHHTMSHSYGREIMDITFVCKPEELAYMRPMIRDMRLFRVPIPSPVYVYGSETYDLTQPPPRIEEETFCRCTLQLVMTGGSMQPWVDQFRDMTSKLRYKIESAQFDQEVEEELSDEYNK
jgi:hypothetical protein